MTRLIILCVSMLCLLCFLLSFEQEAISVPCTEIESPCQTYESLGERCVVGVYSTRFTSVPNNGGEAVSIYVHGLGGKFTEYCGRKQKLRRGNWDYSNEGCGGEFPDLNCE